MTHELKIYPEYFNAMYLNKKNFELRKNDRNYSVGDKLILKEYDPQLGYTGRECNRIITYILSENNLVNLGEFVILSF